MFASILLLCLLCVLLQAEDPSPASVERLAPIPIRPPDDDRTFCGRIRCQPGWYCLNEDSSCTSPHCPNRPRCSRCPENEVWKTCPTCSDLLTCAHRFINFFCIQRCLSPARCVCQPNYLRNSDGMCIPRSECPTIFPIGK